jgi:ribosome-associated protein
MQRVEKKVTPVKLRDAVIKSIADKKGQNITCLNMSNISNGVCDYFVICDGTSKVHVNTIARAVEEEVYAKKGIKVYHHEGNENAEWILLDFVDVVVHIFQPQVREFYNLEGLWADAETIDSKIKSKKRVLR